MSIRLSIIIPCYNCEKTLRQAVDSCYVQGFSDDEFEIIMVDDGSSDGTRELMEEIVNEHSNIHLLYHEENKGGGATRNTGVKKAIGEIIYCLDSDNFFAEDSVGPMITYLAQKNADGVAFFERRFFVDTNILKYDSKYGNIVDRAILLEDLFSEEPIMLDNFFFTKKSFLTTSQYPEHHGFDTQTFEIEYVTKNNKVLICPDSIFYHRQNQHGHKSYYEREYERGLISINSYLAFEPVIQDLNFEVIELMIHFDIFQNNIHGAHTNLRAAISRYVQSGKQLLKTVGETTSPLSVTYVTMCQHIHNKEYIKAQESLEQCILHAQKETPLLQYMQMRITYLREGMSSMATHERIVKYLQDNKMLNRPKYRRIPEILKPLHEIYLRLFK